MSSPTLGGSENVPSKASIHYIIYLLYIYTVGREVVRAL